ncbi:hypothetical protein AVR91_0206390 [Amycolatopsis keratiniphila subsp. keratiniphila]|uniref:Uncharacterized protein n=1 Tax=Amycolatopsis keratiniphila subsp. keratiniphila TaxID=227715 RepID=A0A1W2M1N6_9PSEU|nr:hypothetical protein AVR91_0206390 [Amycolatopsis keratiniphila subsp. keratiniphila]
MMEALSWIAGIAGLVVALGALLLAWRQSRTLSTPAAETVDGRQVSTPSRYRIELQDNKGVQIGDNNTQSNDFGA